MDQLKALTSWITTDPVAQVVLGVVLSGVALACIVAVLLTAVRPLLKSLRARLAWPAPAWTISIRVARWALAVGLAFIPYQPLADLPWLATLAIALSAAEGAESIWRWVKTLASMAGKRVSTAVGGTT